MRKWWGRATFLLVLTACAGQQKPCPEQDVLPLRLTAAKTANDGFPSLVRVYLLKTERGFLDASYADLLRGEVNSFREDQVEARDFVVPPGGGKVLEFARTADRGERYIGIFVGFGSQNGKWKVTAPLPVKNPAYCHEQARELHLQLEGQDARVSEHPLTRSQ